jgi:hypothetical protein
MLWFHWANESKFLTFLESTVLFKLAVLRYCNGVAVRGMGPSLFYSRYVYKMNWFNATVVSISYFSTVFQNNYFPC